MRVEELESRREPLKAPLKAREQKELIDRSIPFFDTVALFFSRFFNDELDSVDKELVRRSGK
jgi:hypothetical protein